MSALRDLIDGSAELGSESDDQDFDGDEGEQGDEKRRSNGKLADSSDEDEDDDDEEAAKAVSCPLVGDKTCGG